MKILLPTLVLTLLLTFCQYIFASPEPTITNQPDPADSLQITLNKISAFHKNDYHHDIFALRHFIEREIMPRFSFQQMTHWVAGPYARYMTADDRASFAAQLRTDFMSMLIEHLGNFDPDRHMIQIGKTRYIQPRHATVEVRVSFQQQQPITLSFRMQQIQQLWKIVDIQSNGISLVMFYRARYISQLRGYQHLTP